MKTSLLLLSMVLGGCQEWMAEPVRVQRHYGESARVAYLAQIYDPARANQPAALAPEGLGDGIKSIKVLQRTYQADMGKPERARQMTTFQTGAGVGGGGGGGGGGGQ